MTYIYLHDLHKCAFQLFRWSLQVLSVTSFASGCQRFRGENDAQKAAGVVCVRRPDRNDKPRVSIKTHREQ